MLVSVIPGGQKKTKAVEWEFPFNCFCFFGPPGTQGMNPTPSSLTYPAPSSSLTQGKGPMETRAFLIIMFHLLQGKGPMETFWLVGKEAHKMNEERFKSWEKQLEAEINEYSKDSVTKSYKV